jgi:hypothetical protein
MVKHIKQSKRVSEGVLSDKEKECTIINRFSLTDINSSVKS